MYDLIIKNGRIVDGTGNPWYKADVAIVGGKIVRISRTELGDARRVLDVKGMVVAPGFYDLHSHSDFTIGIHNKGLNSLHQGVTTEGVGQCGMSVHTLTPEYKQAMSMGLAQFAGEPVPVEWTTLSEWRDYLHKKGIGLNIAPYIGHGTVRSCVMGDEGKGGERYEPTADELRKMKGMVRQAMEQGAFGLSTGLRYAPGRNAYTEEVIELTKVASEFGGIYISHMRSEEDTMIESVWELIRICEEARLPGCVSHHKALFPENWGKPSESMRLVERARARGVDVIVDQYPWEYAREANVGSWFVSHVMKPDMTIEEMKHRAEHLIDLLKDPKEWPAIKKAAQDAYDKDVEVNEKRRRQLATRGVAVPLIWNPATFDYVVHSKTHPEVIGLNFQQIAKKKGKADYWDAIRDIYVDDRGETYAAAGWINEDDVMTILSKPFTTVSTDGAVVDQCPPLNMPWGGTHPRAFGSYPKVLQRYVREKKLVRLEEMVRKMTSLPAGFLGIKDRGLVREGYWADITVFDPDTVECKATWSTPCEYPVGIPYVLVNGQVAIDNGQHTGALGGRVLSR